jgi:hypothetical protein
MDLPAGAEIAFKITVGQKHRAETDLHYCYEGEETFQEHGLFL